MRDISTQQGEDRLDDIRERLVRIVVLLQAAGVRVGDGPILAENVIAGLVKFYHSDRDQILRSLSRATTYPSMK